MESRIVVVVLGHSYVRRLKEYVISHPQLRNLELDCTVHFVGVGGNTILRRPQSPCLSDYIDQALEFHPEIVFVHGGENDLSMPSIKPYNLAAEFNHVAQRLLSQQVRMVNPFLQMSTKAICAGLSIAI
jgi:hypothetical protein